jgi:lipopolysaccharide export LptBFGC system permease protein LptF
MPRRPPSLLGRIVEGMARLSPPRHRDLVRGMLAELDSIGDPAERRRFALGAIAAMARLAVTGYGRLTILSPDRFVAARDPWDGLKPGGQWMSKLTTGRLLLRHAIPFVISFSSLTVLLLANVAVQRVPQLSAGGVPTSQILEVLVLSVPYTLALTIPMAVLLAVSWVFARLGKEGVIALAKRERHGVRRLVTPVLGVAAVIGALTLFSNTQVLPRANGRLVEVLAGSPREPTDRTMTVGELRDAARTARISSEGNAVARATVYEVEIQKKFALAAACLFLALAGAATSIRFPHGGLGLVLGGSAVLFTVYYVSLVTGEALADRQVISPLVAMWMANAFLLAVALLLAWGPSRPDPTPEAETLAIGGS